jgi:DnaA-homolog protein
MRQLPLGVRLKERATFASFLPSGNEEPIAQLQAAVMSGGRAAIWLAGVHASGKSHLLQACCASSGLDMRAGYFPLAALSEYGAESLDGAGALSVVCVDDLDRIAGNAVWERAVFNLYREIDERRAIFVAAARAPAATLPWQLPDLRSRLAACTSFVIHALDEEAQIGALQLRARLRGLELPLETARYLQRRVPRDMATLADLLDTLDDASLEAQRRLTIPFIRAVLDARLRA